MTHRLRAHVALPHGAESSQPFIGRHRQFASMRCWVSRLAMRCHSTASGFYEVCGSHEIRVILVGGAQQRKCTYDCIQESVVTAAAIWRLRCHMYAVSYPARASLVLGWTYLPSKTVIRASSSILCWEDLSVKQVNLCKCAVG